MGKAEEVQGEAAMEGTRVDNSKSDPQKRHCRKARCDVGGTTRRAIPPKPQGELPGAPGMPMESHVGTQADMGD